MGIELKDKQVRGPIEFNYSGDFSDEPRIILSKNGVQLGRIFGRDCYTMIRSIIDGASPMHRKEIKDALDKLDV